MSTKNTTTEAAKVSATPAEQSDIFVAVQGISDPAAREQVRRRINRMGVLQFKLTDRLLLTDPAHAGVSGWSAQQLQAKAPLLKSGVRKGWPSRSLSADQIRMVESFAPAPFVTPKPETTPKATKAARKARKERRKTTRTVASQESAARIKVSDSEMDTILSMESEDSLATTFRPVAA